MTAVADPVARAKTQRKSLKKIKDEVAFYPHQIDGVRKLVRMGSFILADEMGLGKSLQALTVAACDYERGPKSTLIVSPATLKYNWEAEILEHTSFSYIVLNGTPKKRKEQIAEYNKGNTDILIVNYELVGTHLATLNGMDFDHIIYDEAHYIKSPKAKRTKAAQSLRSSGRHMLLTGSPLLNQVNDLWSLLHRIAPGEFPHYYAFLNRYCVYGGFQDKEIVGVKNEQELRDKLQNYMVRRLKEDVLNLPDKQHVQVMVDLHPEQRVLYKQAVEEMLIDLPNDPQPMELENALVKFLRLKQICGTTATIPGHDDHSLKLDRAIEMVREIVDNGEPVVVFTQFREVMARFAARLAKAKPTPIGCDQIHGGVDQPDRVPLVKAWGEASKNGDHRVLLVLLHEKIASGFNATAAKKCIFLDKLFSPKLNEQAEDRLHRIGASLTQPIQIFEMIVRNTIEQRVEIILKRKRKTFDTLVEESKWKRALYKSLKEDLNEL